jgi:hypothetical protein
VEFKSIIIIIFIGPLPLMKMRMTMMERGRRTHSISSPTSPSGAAYIETLDANTESRGVTETIETKRLLLEQQARVSL